MSRLPLFYLCIAAGWLIAPAALSAQDDDSPSIEELIERYRERRESVLEAMSAEVSYLLDQLRDHAKNERRNSMDQVRDKLIDLGSEAALLLVPRLDPGKKASRTDLSFSNQVAMVLEESSIASIHEPLIRLARSGSLAGRRLAIRVLGSSADSARVSPILIDLYTSEEIPPRAAILTALARLGGAENLDFVTDRLRSEEKEEIEAALIALATARTSEAADKILVFAADTRSAVAHVSELCAWYKACSDIFDKQHAASVLSLARSSRISTDDRIALVNLLSAHDKDWPSGTKKSLEEMSESGNRELREAILVALALSGDRGAKRDLLAPYEAKLSRNGRWADGWIDLANVEYRVREYRDAIKHYETAMKLGRIDTRRQRDVYLGLARCYALDKKYKDAQQWLQRAPISRKQLADLALDPDFVEMAAHSKYGDTFGVERG